ncbi:hypothetical protein [Lacrimispora amygdalina]|uniref:hypothetical protein n=1 Tax=Lacrimispora amygdalina TaxID=253257 RepID=UPI001144667C|nr:hypothetical protein [Lacrimispora amygdalina]
MKRMTFDEFDELVDRLKKNTYECDDWWPSPEELNEKMGNEINANIPFLVWILETNNPPETTAEKESQRYINKLLRDNLKLYDPNEENERTGK